MSTGSSLAPLFALANAFKEGDLAVGGTADERLRNDARRELLGLTLGTIRRTAFVDDGVTAALDRSRDRQFDGELDHLTIHQLKAMLLGPHGPRWIAERRAALTSEAIAAVAKVMNDDELSSIARALFNPLEGDGLGIGAPRHLGSRIQPNSPGDDHDEILFSILDGLSFGCGDVIVGLNPAADELDSIVRLEQLLEQVVRRLALPTRYCVLSDIVKQHEARRQAAVDVGFQSLAGTSKALAGMVGLDVDGIADLAAAFGGLYFETGQGSAVTNDAAEGVDMVTLESRTYGVACHIRRRVAESREGVMPWTIVNDVAGFIGPEVFRTGEQLERACLEDAVMAKLHGLTMGLDVCATFHMGIAPLELRELTSRIAARAAPAYLMAVAGNADPMLGYLTTSFREHPRLRQQHHREMTTSMRRRLTGLGVVDRAAADAAARRTTIARLYARYAKAGGDRRTDESLSEAADRRLDELAERGFDLASDASASDARLDAIYRHARRALYASVDEHVLHDVTPEALVVATTAVDRDDYLSHPAAGERLRDEHARRLRAQYAGKAPQLQIVISDGLNADAVNEQLRGLLAPARRALADAGIHVAGADIVVRNGRVRVGYEIGGLVGADVIVHLIGERPGTGLNTLSAYITYGRDRAGQFRWSRALDHSASNAICGIHPHGKPPQAAVLEIARTATRAIAERRSGVALAAARPQ